MDEVSTILTKVNNKSSVTPMVGAFVSASTAGFVIDVGGGRIPAQPASSYLPVVNESVRVWFVDGIPYVLGPTIPKAGQGTVVSVASKIVTLSTAFGTVKVPYDSTLTPTVGQIMHLTWQGGGYADSVMSISPVPGKAPPGPSTTATVHTDKFTALDAGSFNTGWWTAQIRADDSDLGAWFYGTKMYDTIPASASIQSVQIYISPAQLFGSAPNFGINNQTSKGGGGPSLSSLTAVGVSPGWVNLPAAFGDSLKNGGGGFGVGVAHGGLNVFNSLTDDGESGALLITSTY